MSTDLSSTPAAAGGTIRIGDDLTVNRLGFGAMRLTGPGFWGDPADPDEAVRVVRRAVELGVNFIDTADAYGPFTSDRIIKKALHPYADDLVIATKVGLTRPGPDDWRPVGRPEYLRQQTELNLRHLGLETIPLLQLHRIDPAVPLEDQVGELAELRNEGKIRHIGLSEVTVEETEKARAVAPIVSVQNLYNVAARTSEDVLRHTERHGMVFIPWFPLAMGQLAAPGSPLEAVLRDSGATPAQLALAWLLRHSPALLPIPGTSSVGHLEENVGGASIRLSDDDYRTITAAC
ncbi:MULTISPECIES: aldo/keto reductase [unclassified Streptomyces]|uniref:aldo/keto reductase n=1 Tax=unclassified Streptomyces TaxID=2593676 RepID=UPI001F04C76D|nr:MULTISPECIES: aldo/keto reductase [unclassified Streptomyces]MCH0566308.1 aldo/keto reductase [Streptomyces sp. MUM 2J]MCH0572980.1 aldo/keto reductase [Streptomyces sp. MUM 136J]